MESKVPKSATFLGMVEGDLDHSPGLFWKIEDRYYLLRLRRSSYKWALVRISWDDNWSRYQWSGNARGSGFADANHAARALVMAAFKNWGIDPESDEYAHYRNFVARLPNG
jgi:hypothetical protein